MSKVVIYLIGSCDFLLASFLYRGLKGMGIWFFFGLVLFYGSC